MLLQPFLNMVVELGKFDSHPYSSVAGSDYTAGLDLFIVHPKGNFHFCTHRQRKQGFYITAAAANVSGICLHVSAAGILEANLQGKPNFMTSPSPFIAGRCRSAFFLFGKLQPRGLLARQNFCSGFNLPFHAGINYPNYFAANFLFAVLHANHIASFQRVADPRESGAIATEVGGVDVLKKRSSIRIHAPYPYGDDGREPRFRSSIHVFLLSMPCFQGMAYHNLALAAASQQFGSWPLSKDRVRSGRT